MPDESGTPQPPKPLTPPPIPASGESNPTRVPPRTIPKSALPKLPAEQPATNAPVVPTPLPPAPTQAENPVPAPEPAPSATKQTDEEKPKQKKLSFPKFSMLSKKPGELLSRRRNKRDVSPAPGSDKPGEKLPAPALPHTEAAATPAAPAEAPKTIQKVVLDPTHKGGRNRPQPTPAGGHTEKSPHPRELGATAPATPPVPPLKSTAGEKTPAPALTPAGGGAPVQVPKKEVHRARAPWLKILIAVVLRLIVLGAIVGLGFFSYYQLRETRLEGYVNLPPGFQLKRVALVRDFRQDVLNLAEELALSRAPLLSDIDQLESVVSRSKSDVAGREERLRLLREEVEKADKEILGVMKEATDAGNKVWAGPGAQLDAEFAQKKDEFHKRIIERAAGLRLNYVDNTDYKDPEVWVNAFRLSLYDAPKTVNTVNERTWAEKELSDWKKYVAAYQDRQTAIKKQVEEIQTSPQGRISEINQRVADLNQRVTETEQEIEPIRQELKQGQTALDKLKTEQAGLEAPFYKQVIEAPEGSLVTKINFDVGTNRFFWRSIDRDPQYPPGTYNLWVSALSKDGEEYWTYVPVTFYLYRTTQIILQPGAFVPVRTILRSGATPK